MAASSSSGPSVSPFVRRPEEFGYFNPAQLRHFVETIEERWDAVCQILRADKPDCKGTGCLIGGNFLITNHHVIESVEAAKNATALFFRVTSQSARKGETVVKINRMALDPERYFFTCAAKESGIFKIPQPADKDNLDFTLVALKSNVYLSEIECKAFSIFRSFPYQEGEQIYIIHHPDRLDAKTMIIDDETTLSGDAKVSHGLLRKIYPYYFHYSTPASRGSSGGAAINVNGQMIALHYQKIPTCSVDCSLGSSCYSGIRIDQVVKHLKDHGQIGSIEEKIREDRQNYRNDVPSRSIAFQREERKTAVLGTQGPRLFPIEGVYTDLDPELTIRRSSRPPGAFGSEEWARYFGEVGEEPLLPSNIDEILTTPCPFWKDRLVRDTHFLVLIPGAVGGQSYTFNLLKELIKVPKGGGHRTDSCFILPDSLSTSTIEGSYWGLMTRDVIPGSRNKRIQTQLELIRGTHHQLITGSYREQQAIRDQIMRDRGRPKSIPGLIGRLPTALEAATAILTCYVKSGARLYPDKPWTATRSSDEFGGGGHGELVVGVFSRDRLFIGVGEPVNEGIGAACFWTL